MTSCSYKHKLLTCLLRFFSSLVLFILTCSFTLPVLFTTEVIIEEETDADLNPPQVDIVTGEDYIVIPIKYAGRLFMVEAVVDGQSGNLIFDTGASGIVMNQTYFRKYAQTNTHKSNGITGAVTNTSCITIGSMRISGLEAKKLTASVADLSHIENQKGVKVLGLFGFKMIKDFEIVLDINRQVLFLYRINKNGDRISSSAPPFNADYSQKFKTSKNIVFIRGTVADRELKFCLDTGAEINAISSNCNKNVLKTIKITGNSNLNGVGSSQSKVLSGMMTDFRFGDRDLTSMTSIITSLDALSEAYETSLDGMLGYDFLKKGIFCINFVKRQIGIMYSIKQ